MDAHVNFAYSTVLTPPSPATSGTSLVLQSGDGAKFPTVFPFNVVVWITGANPLSSNAEIVQVTAISGDTMTIVRTQEGTSARTIVAGDQVALAITAKTLNDVEGNRITGSDTVIQQNFSMVVPSDYEISLNNTLEILNNGILEIT